MFTKIVRQFFLLLVVFFGLTSIHARSEESIAVIYPQIREPYQTVYRQITDGIKLGSSRNVIEIIAAKNSDHSQIKQELIKKNILQVITLGKQGYTIAKKLEQDLNINIVSGALPIVPNGISGVSLLTDPDSLFAYLNIVSPEVKTIHVAYSKRNQWLIDIAKQSAAKRNLQLDAKLVRSSKDAINYYEQLFEVTKGKQEAIWLPIDKISANDKIILPIILEKSWSRNIVVFSSKPSHAKRGALFSTYPDNQELGKHLVKLLHKQKNKPEEKIVEPLKSLQLAVNLRTAAHLGIKFNATQLEFFKLTFPE